MDILEPAPKPEGKLRTVSRAIWALPFIKKLVVVALVAAMAKLGVVVSPEVAAGMITVADTIEASL